MVALVERMLALHQRLAAAKAGQEKAAPQPQIEAMDKQFDQLVYKLYGLSEGINICLPWHAKIRMFECRWQTNMLVEKIMLSIVLTEIEEKINHLSRQEKLWLIERIARRLQEDVDAKTPPTSNDFARQLAAMANDPQIRAELDQIEQEFGITETDGLKGA